MLPIPLLPLLVLIQKFVRKCDEEDIKMCRTWVGNVEAAYDPKVGKCLRFILDGKQLELFPLLE